ncbi:hypothetical protein AQ938_06990 [Burkholderia pseudomallei]|uniref:hypothetical protein n=1 Tax=Burkholderia pseudomallei TaxID=28450 RepID=UPI000055B58A|nr:hypothetical protein [Burkholderia pseudomallei]AJX61593.1 hypothetical protein DP47_3368 [Burkholderia pseudomallei Pasteur 52237]EDO95611.1 hypothetical protein BURPSPAST_C1332 [Burkholderia pseudomallei Pasteur 52237]MWA16593.1 hypothetical protein [Burkholderia pseudomallei]OND79018.1 hypothetical protein AQ938_06990 [Burkholderia pseudomallei]VBQ80867.1 Uncharacterised protein [Burkholderia pseudomallei]
MSINNFSVGRDISLDIVTGSGPLQINLITEFTSNQESTEVKVKGIDGITRFVRFFDGWKGKFNVERQDATLDQYFSQLEQNFFSGIGEQSVTITESIQEANGSISQFRYLGVLLKYDDAGGWKGDSTVKQAVSFVCSRRIQIA